MEKTKIYRGDGVPRRVYSRVGQISPVSAAPWISRVSKKSFFEPINRNERNKLIHLETSSIMDIRQLQRLYHSIVLKKERPSDSSCTNATHDPQCGIQESRESRRGVNTTKMAKERMAIGIHEENAVRL